MAFKLLSFCALVAVARAGVISSPAVSFSTPVAKSVITVAPVAKTIVATPIAKAVVAEEFDAHPQYSYSYGISDALTGDSKSQQESRDGDLVRGFYSVVDPDGTKRTVEYTADAHSGFNAVVHREPLAAVKAVAAAPAIAAKTVAVQPVVAPLAVKTIIAQPAVATYAAPALYHH
ncbi:cuticle protein-like [Toxorhynchites rutilus septentrionalis]|uniref:cuticle protein-like n=1 Tax=Toxorhynchites rutilus septentrionalis TaxID=329112 RepID=UPI002478B881|nr:cuticle protein-like [Toxorhynchites rutilus septentrionalis]